MSQDILSDAMNEIMNAKRAKKDSLVIRKHSKLLIKILDIMKEKGYIDYELQDEKLKVLIKEISECKSIKPRYNVNKDKIDKYVRRFLPARNLGCVIISTNKGLMIHSEAAENKIGGSLIAYFY